MKTIAIIGAGGYVGNALVAAFKDHYHVIAVYRGNFPVIRKHVNVAYRSTADETPFTADVIINTAYSSNPDIRQNKLENIQVASYIGVHAGSHTKIIHLSTLAVFGFQLERENTSVPVRSRWDDLYIESKIHMENVMLKKFHGNLQILRLGNVWGPASNTWLTPLADALLYGKPCLYTQTVHSNVTCIQNLSAYIDFLIRTDKSMRIHHVAELGHIPWQFWIEKLSGILNVNPVTFSKTLSYPATIMAELDLTLLHKPVALLKKLKQGRFLKSRIDRLVRKIPYRPRTVQPGKPPLSNTEASSPGFILTLSCTKQFKSIMLEDFTAPYNEHDIMQTIAEWMREAGYINE